jgi:oxygen-independent coproporphyrinogen-3 oxidase
MILEKSIQMMQKSFEKTRYEFTEIPDKVADNPFGIYVNVPFCRSKCNFCPFYKELYDEALKKRYLETILLEIDQTTIKGTANWIYFGGGTPNVLTLNEISKIVKAIRNKVQISSMGIELLPSLVNRGFLEGLKALGFTKVSFGIETLSVKANQLSGRKMVTQERIRSLFSQALDLGLWVNVDLILGLQGQDADSFLEDIRLLASFEPSQITTYPMMSIRGSKVASWIPDKDKYETIEAAGEILKAKGFSRSSIWCFSRGDDVYDSSREELIYDYIGFGPAAFSTFGKYKVVNPDVKSYLHNYMHGKRLGFVSLKSKESDHWRKFARMIYSLSIYSSRELPWYINAYTLLLLSTGIRKNGSLSEKGVMFAHDLTKTVVESLPFPIQNKASVSNYTIYEQYKNSI